MNVAYESRVAGQLERRHLTKKNRDIYIALEEVDFIWSLEQIKEFREMWDMHFSVEDMAEYFERSLLEVALLIMSQEIDGQIKPRK